MPVRKEVALMLRTPSSLAELIAFHERKKAAVTLVLRPDAARVLPSGENARQKNSQSTGPNRPTCRWVAKSHIFTSPLMLPVASSLPLGEKLTAPMPSLCAGHAKSLSPVLRCQISIAPSARPNAPSGSSGFRS